MVTFSHPARSGRRLTTANPFSASSSITIGWVIIVPPFVSWYRTFERTRHGAAAGAVPFATEANPHPQSSFLDSLLVVALIANFLPVELV